jgi:hypothetical protein
MRLLNNADARMHRLAAGIATAIELDRELGGRFRYCALMRSGMWTTMFVVAAGDEAAIFGLVGYMPVALTCVYVVGSIGVIVNKARERWGTRHNV